MKYVLYKMSFKTPLHIGKKLLTDGEYTIAADTLFSALCQEALKMGGSKKIEELVTYVKNDELRISDALPFIKDMLYVPKPFVQIERNNNDSGNSIIKKSFKKLKYVPISKLKQYLDGNIDPKKENDIFDELGKYKVQAKVYVDLEDDSKPYAVGTYTFSTGNGLYVCIAYNEKSNVIDLIKELFTALSYVGIGGKISSGFGKFDLVEEELPQELLTRLTSTAKTYMTLAMSMPTDDELENVMTGACYSLERRGGYVQSDNYDEEFLRKNDFYSFKSGSCFKKTYNGDVYDVSCGGKHAVYRYAKPMMLEVLQ